MILLQCVQLNKSFGVEPILSNVKLEVQTGERTALVGRNGTGKSTLLKIITGELPYDSGEIIKPKDVTIGYLSQNTGLESTKSIWDEMMSVFSHLRKMESDLRNMEKKMSDPQSFESNEAYEKLLADYDQLQVRFNDEGGYQYEADIRSVLSGLHFDDRDYDTPINTLSGGQKTRLALGKLLLTKPDLLILDEPTNHLDIETLTWLENYLNNYSGAILLVSHDRYFLDKIVDNVYELSRTKTTKFTGNYSTYLEKKAKQYEQEMKRFEKHQEEVKRLEDFVQKNIARASTSKRAQSRRKQLEKMETIDRPEGDLASAKFQFDIKKQSGNDVLSIEKAALGYGDETILQDVNLHLNRGESVALIGPNGIGKTSLLKAINGNLSLKEGNIRYGSNVTIGYYDQEQTNLRSNKDVLHELWDDYPLTPEKDIRTVLGNFLFSGEDVLKSVQDLSGGEKARLALAKLMMKKANLLILDEPTNHLDLDSKEVLESALIEYPGTILFVSHDRYFINRMASRIAEVSPQGIDDYLGDYDYYVAKKWENAERERLKLEEEMGHEAKGNSKKKPHEQDAKQAFEQDKAAKRKERQRKRKIEDLEANIEEKETHISELENQLLDPDVYQDHERAASVNEQLEKLRHEVDDLFIEWEQLQTEDE
ncbi:ABC-F family ATP-binding cassette domain-containing protein [Texcoconibacillus texcoconensis]|uniref:ATP-binding cassette subfamily F protein 3 n=1 Tax=Texcoconibacillus texcoconensis TaxID=1095777 RepID=A0A840QML7_9BACI|nr:ABC-F type ribosomal protection protein [Texcoconibacillus texcoconensis]MBB5172624.1 ATP-binding cassette subfamily F protein 3 [Texcoconibacillus texcoconensis]